MSDQIINFKQFSEKLFTSGMPTKEQLEHCCSVNNIHVVINLAPHSVQNALVGEDNIVSSLGIQYINIPVDWSNPTTEMLNKFMDVMNTFENQNVYVHCQANFRASAFVTLYRILRKGWDIEKAMNGMHEIWDDEVYPVWNEFIIDSLNDFIDKKDND